MLTDVFDDEMTRELPSAQKTFTDLDPFACSVAPVASGASVATREALPELTVVIGAIVLVWFCAVAGIAGVVAGRSSTEHDHVRVPRVATVIAAHEAVTEPPLTAPAKADAAAEDVPLLVAPVPRAVSGSGARAVAAPEPHRPGFQRPKSLRRR